MSTFYDDFASLYHLIFADWDASMARQGDQLSAIIRSEWPGHQTVLDLSCGIGTQAIALARVGFRVTASDVSSAQVERAAREAKQRGQSVTFAVCDMRQASFVHGNDWDVVISCDNALPHLLDDSAISAALKEMVTCLRPGGGCLITVRDYEKEPRGRDILKPYVVRVENGVRFSTFAVWDFVDDEHYDLTMYVVQDPLEGAAAKVCRLRSRCYAIATDRLLSLMAEAGFEKVRRLDGAFYQPVLVGTKPLDSAYHRARE